MERIKRPKIVKDSKRGADMGAARLNESQSATPYSADADLTRSLYSPVEPIRRLPDGSIDQSHYADKARLHRAEAWMWAIKSIWNLIGTGQ